MNTILTCAFFAYGMYTLQRPGFLMEAMREFWKKNLPKGLHEPFFECGVCVSSVWGGFAYAVIILCDFLRIDVLTVILHLPITLIAATGVCAVIDRGVKAFEKIYGYKSPAQKKTEEKWNYLLPYDSMRSAIVNCFIHDAYKKQEVVIEIGGYHAEWDGIKYINYTETKPLDKSTLPDLFNRLSGITYNVIILGLAFDGDIRILQNLIRSSKTTIIEYSDDGISRQQIDQLTEGLSTKMVIPEYDIATEAEVPKACGIVNKRKIIFIQP